MENIKQIVVLKLGDVQYGFPIEEVKEIIRYMPPTPMPDTSGYIEGVISLRGRIHTVIDLRNFLGMDKKKFDNNTKIIIANSNNAGFIVDDVNMIVTPKLEEIDTNVGLSDYFSNNYVQCILKIGGSVIFVLDMLCILDMNKENRSAV